MKLSADRKDEIIDRLKTERKSIDRLDTDIADVGEDLKSKKKERELRGSLILALVRELECPEQTCTACGVLRAILDPIWPKSTRCPNCSSAEARAKAQAAAGASK